MSCNELLANYFKSLSVMGVISEHQMVSMFGSSMLAIIGLMFGDFSVLLGAMLVSPMGGPLRFIGLSLVKGNMHYIWKCILMLLFMTVYAFVTGYCVAYINNEHLNWVDLPSKPMEKMQDSIFLKINFLLGCLSGLISPYAIMKKDTLMMAGLFISVSLLPPIISSGMYYRLYHQHKDNNELKEQYFNATINSFKISVANWIGLGICSFIGFKMICTK